MRRRTVRHGGGNPVQCCFRVATNVDIAHELRLGDRVRLAEGVEGFGPRGSLDALECQGDVAEAFELIERAGPEAPAVECWCCAHRRLQSAVRAQGTEGGRRTTGALVICQVPEPDGSHL